MIHARTGERIGGVAGITLCTGYDVITRFADGGGAVMTGGAGSGDCEVIDSDVCPAISVMTAITGC